MKTKGTTENRDDLYLDLVRRVPLRPIRREDELDRAISLVDELLDRPTLRLEEHDYLDVLSDLIERYESAAHPIEPASDAAMLAHLIEAKRVTQAVLARETGIAESTVSEVLAGKRDLTRNHIGKLASYFHVGPTVFSFRN
jgi:HTH-type transcriptional regulator / antitoxin HigA